MIDPSFESHHGKHVTYTSLSSKNKAFKLRRDIHHQKSKTGISVAPQKGLMSSKICFLKTNIGRLSDLVFDRVKFFVK